MFHTSTFFPRRIVRQAVIGAAGLMTLAAVSLGGAQAAPVTFAYEGTISSRGPTDSSALDYLFGQTMRVQYTFDSAAVDNVPGDPEYGQYFDAISALTVSIGSQSATQISPSSFFITDNETFFGDGDRYNVNNGLVGDSISGFDMSYFNLTLSSPTDLSSLASDSLPVIQPDPADFESAEMILFFHDSANSVAVNLYATDLTIAAVVTSVPEPGMLAVFGLGLVGLGFARRRTAA